MVLETYGYLSLFIINIKSHVHLKLINTSPLCLDNDTV